MSLSTSASRDHDSKSKNSSNLNGHHQNQHHSSSKPPKLPGRPKAITASMSLLRSVRTFLTPSGSQAQLGGDQGSLGFRKAKIETDLFPATNPEVDGEDCLHDCNDCTVHYPAKFKIDEHDTLYGHVKGWETHLIVGTGKTDWVRDVTDEKASVMQAVGRVGVDRRNGKVMLSASNMPVSSEGCDGVEDGVEEGADCLLLPAWTLVENVKPSQVDVLMKEVVETSVTNSTPLGGKTNVVVGNGQANGRAATSETTSDQDDTPDVSVLQIGGANVAEAPSTPSEGTQTPQGEPQQQQQQQPQEGGAGPQNTKTLTSTPLPPSISNTFKTRPIPHSYLILMCSHKTRDARCGQSAPLLRKEFERILRPMGLYRDLHDDRPGGVGLYFINHVGGHKYSANVMIYRREGSTRTKDGREVDGHEAQHGEAVQLIWLARVTPEDCENIVRFTILQGKLVKPQRQLRGGFDRQRGLLSW